MPEPIKKRLRNSSVPIFTLYVIMASFCTYSCMYAFRKPFTVASFENEIFAGIDLKIWLVTAQVLGYTISKFVGIKVISEMKKKGRSGNIIKLILIAELALVLFALVPSPWNIIFLFLNGIPLGMIWGIVFSYLEGRKTTELLGAGLSVTFIFSSGFVKSIGKAVLSIPMIDEFWMPAVTGALFLLPLWGFTYLLDQIPPPTKEDIIHRTKRKPMNAKERRKLLKRFAPGLISLILVYVVLSAFRDFRDNFAAELWASLGLGNSSLIFVASEIPVSLIVLAIMGATVAIKDNTKALFFNHWLVWIGVLIIGISTYLAQSGYISGTVWMICNGLGLYMGYIPFNTIFFERLIAAFRHPGNVGFLIYLADSFGYAASVGILFYKAFFATEMNWLDFFSNAGYILMFICSLFLLFSFIYFKNKLLKNFQTETHTNEITFDIPAELNTK